MSKIVLYGDSGVGKTSLVRRYVEGVFKVDESPTIGVDPRVIHNLYLWDTSGNRRYYEMTQAYAREAAVLVFVFDLTNRDSFENVEPVWLRNVTPNCLLFLVGNKSDLTNQRTVGTGEAEEFAHAHGMLYIEMSACANTNVRSEFETMLQEIRYKPTATEVEIIDFDQDKEEEEKEEKRRFCCC
jgi:Ras-related protein Rab-39A/Ras-related protein Rab-39B